MLLKYILGGEVMLGQNKRVQVTVEIAILSALGIGLDYLFGVLTGSLYPNGGSISLAMVPIMLISYRRGIGAGLVTGGLVGTLQLIFGGHILQFFQMILDYPVPYLLVGFSGIFVSLNRKKDVKNIALGAVVGGLLRYFSHFLAGATFWRSYAPTEFWGIKGFNPVTYSIFYNGLYMIPSIIFCVIVLVLLLKTTPQLFLDEEILDHTEMNWK